MLEIFIIPMAFPLAFIIVTLLYRKLTSYSIIFLLTIAVYFVGVIFWYFFVISYGGNNNTFIFPDELTYLFGESTGFYGDIVKLIVSLGSTLAVRFINVFSYTFGLLWLTTELIHVRLNNNSSINTIKFIYVSMIAALGSYWSFFILKEGMTVLSISMYLISYHRRNKPLKIIALILALFVRFEVAIAIIFAEIVVFLWKKSKMLLYLLLSITIIAIILYLNMPNSEALKLSFLSRRYGESDKIYDSAAIQTAQLGFLQFITSYTYFETIAGNILRSLIPFYLPFSPISTPLTLFNLIGCILVFKKFKEKRDVPTIFGVVILLLLMGTISVPRYVTVIIIPLTIYLLLDNTKRKDIRKNTTT
ncbi:hypothetical protein [Oceanobacillus massiliensis]|uniref:hypothetical protein n=1 Tax=Oceanobacillus massiliensis TaxID=1465765 RepID=UPI0002893ECE|nr:hypothetical protein [Oceanobacillus massiliensis]